MELRGYSALEAMTVLGQGLRKSICGKFLGVDLRLTEILDRVINEMEASVERFHWKLLAGSRTVDYLPCAHLSHMAIHAPEHDPASVLS